MKKMLLATALALLITGCAQQTFTVQNKPAAPVAPKETITIISSFLELGRRKLSVQPKFVAAQKMLLKTETQQTFVNGLLGFITLGIYTPLESMLCITHNNCIGCHRYGQLYLLLDVILLGSLPVVLHSDQPLSGEISGPAIVCQSGGCIIHAGGSRQLHALTDRLLMCNRRRPAASSRRASFSALASANSFVYFASSAATSR